ncbi:ribonuclease E/G [Qipengyuania oceanensis]|uniref:Ribonuclease n=1 Tax=Qipengyuania oceanensis TaxID=1463597 RepID=A0A844YJ59_9SPHN|nr:ribonuclease E/G [Qipengyuania oceanensis]MXO63535.1 ribonuclease [Qipengyuania oceanensis]
MADWLVEHGIGEERWLLVHNEQPIAARLFWPGDLRAGELVEARLTSRRKGSSRGVATTESGLEILVDRLPPSASEGATVAVEITRAAVAERGRLKLAQARIADAAKAQDGAPPYDVVHRFPAGLWEEIWDAAWGGSIAFSGGSLLFDVTPAMCVVDIDGDLPPRELALAAIPAIVRALRWFDLGGSIAIDFPTIPDKAGRKAVDAALEDGLAGWPHERTAMNGFGLVQIVARLEGPSLLHRMANARIGAAARMVLRKAELLDGAGAIQLTVHPAVKTKLKPEWLHELARRTGRDIRVEADPAIAIGAEHAQMVER